MQLPRTTATWSQKADYMPNYSDLRPITCRTIPILGRSHAELFRSYFGLQRADLNSALSETRA